MMSYCSTQAPSSSHAKNGFSLIELAVTLAVLAILTSSLLSFMLGQVHARRREETRITLETAREAILSFAAAQGRLPCPASGDSHGMESFCKADSGNCKGDGTVDVQSHGNCSNFYDGYLPAASLGLAPLDDDGFLRDPWSESQRIRYAVHDAQIGTLSHVLTGTDRIRQATMSSVIGTGTPVTYLYICASVSSASVSTNCGTGANARLLLRNVPVVIFSLGPNGALDTSGKSVAEAENLDGDRIFVSSTPTQGKEEFDDQLTWVSMLAIFDRLMRAGRLP